MKIKSLHLENIRSYVNEKIDFPSGMILFEGDIGSGKSTILLGIEFALFGLSADISGKNLLRMGKQAGSATLVFESEGREYAVRRSIKKKAGSVVQEAGYIILDSQKLDLSPTEMREKILDILKFNEDISSRSSSKIFRYAIFTPQEEIKTILSLNPGDRLQTLRKAFGIEDYRIAKDNAKNIVRKIKSVIDVKTGICRGIPETKQKIEDNKKLYDDLIKKEKELSNHLQLKKKDLQSVEKNIVSLQSQKEKVAGLKSNILSLKQNINSKQARIDTLSSKIKKAEISLKMLEKEFLQLGEAEKPDLSKESLQKDYYNLQKKVSEFQRQKGKIEVKIENYNSLISKGICPTCEQKIHGSDFTKQVDELKSRLSVTDNEIINASKQLEETNVLLKKHQKYEVHASKKDSFQKQIADKKNTLSFDAQEFEKEKKEFNEYKLKYDQYVTDLEKLSSVSNEFSNLEAIKRDLISKINLLISEHSSVSQRIKDMSEKQNSLSDKLEKLKKIEAEKNKLSKKLIWIRDFFMPSLDSIEQHVLLSLNREFDNKFKFWFELLMESSDIRVFVDENFTPSVEQNNYSISVSSLSGGEKTSLALAYRLALNNLVRRVCSSLGSNLIIMDEPTDGFSKEQLFKIKDVLEELNCDQTIIVSHEKELESFVDTIFRITKHNHISEIEKIS